MVVHPFRPQLLNRREVYTFKSDMLRLEATDHRIIDVHRVLRILQAAPWQRSMLESNVARLTSDPLPTRLDRCVIELENRSLMGVGGAGVNVASAYIDSPFWKCVQREKANLELCLQCLQDDESQGIPRMADGTLFRPIPGADGQVQVVFPLVFLIFATFDIPIPLAGSVLWRAHRVGLNQGNQANPLVSIYECIDLTVRTPWYTTNGGNKDRHHLKENLRQGIFDTGTLSPRAVVQLMSWADGGGDADNTVLENLVTESAPSSGWKRTMPPPRRGTRSQTSERTTSPSCRPCTKRQSSYDTPYYKRRSTHRRHPRR
jgi:hypothetical protein